MPALLFAVLLAQLASTLFMTGLIWFVQIIHYPLFGSVGKAEFAAYEQQHTQLTALVVGPPMLLELACTGALLWLWPKSLPAWPMWSGIVLLAIIWLSTAVFQIPAHARLEAGFEAATHIQLVQTNWLRTIAWTLRSALAIFMFWALAVDARAIQ